MKSRNGSAKPWAGVTIIKAIFQHLMEMRQIIQEQDEKKEEEDKVKARQKRLGEIGSISLDVRTEGFLKPKNKRSHSLKNIISVATNTIQRDSPEEEEVNFLFYKFLLFYMRMI